MDYASIGRRKLEELRQQKSRIQKKTAESEDPDGDGLLLREELERVVKERDALREQLGDSLHQVEVLKNQLQDSRTQADSTDRIVAELRQSVKALSIERDAAVMAKEDLLAQLRMTRKRLQEAEDEQYKAEEDAASLRAELQHLQHSGMSSLAIQEPQNFASQEISSMKIELQNAYSQLQRERERVAMEEQRAAKLAADKEELEVSLAQFKAAAAKAAAKAADDSNKWKSKADGGRYEQHLRELASMVERLERGRQKLLSEIDGQSLEIERLFMENDGLLQSLNEARELATQWEHQLKESMKQNVQLGEMLNDLRKSPAPMAVSESDMSAMKLELANAIAQRDELSLKVSQLSVELASARHGMNSINRLYKPALANIESRLLQVKHSSLPVEVA